MATNSASEISSSHDDQELAKFLQDIYKTTELLKERILYLSAKYPVTARENSMNDLVEKLQRDIQARLHRIHPPPTPSPLPSVPSEESLPSPIEEVPYPIELYDNLFIRRRTLDCLSNLDQSLPRKKKVKEIVNVEILTNEKYDPAKRAITWEQSKELSTLAAISLTESERYEGEDEKSYPQDMSNIQALIIDIGKLNFKHQSVPYILFDGEKCDSTQGVFSLTAPEHTNLKECDLHNSLETAIKIASSNYEYWSSIYYKGLRNKDKDPMQRSLVKDYLRQYVKNPLRSTGVIYFYRVQKTLENSRVQSQVYIGKSEGPFEEKLKKLHQFQAAPTLVKLALQSQAVLLSEANDMDKDRESITRNIALIIDFGYTDEFFDKFKARLDKGDKLSALKKNYIEYFGARSPIGLN